MAAGASIAAFSCAAGIGGAPLDNRAEAKRGNAERSMGDKINKRTNKIKKVMLPLMV